MLGDIVMEQSCAANFPSLTGKSLERTPETASPQTAPTTTLFPANPGPNYGSAQPPRRLRGVSRYVVQAMPGLDRTNAKISRNTNAVGAGEGFDEAVVAVSSICQGIGVIINFDKGVVRSVIFIMLLNSYLCNGSI